MSAAVRWGATPEDWCHFDLILGLTADLLPVVSNPEAKISPESKMKGLGKTPSAYNRAGNVAGLKDWTDQLTTPYQIEKWAKESDYGICIQTRLVRALDVDVPETGLSGRIVAAFGLALGLPAIPVRMRHGTGKQLLAFELPGDLRKRSFKVDGGLVEFLATGQQFVAVGTHPSGTRYEWAGGLPAAFPTVDLSDFEQAWAALVAEFAIEPERRSVRRDAGGEGGGVETPDDVAAHLEAEWETFGTQGGKLFVTCPWKAGHSGDSGETEAAWLLAGTGGYAMGHFECLHASCADRTDAQFMAQVGYRPALAEDFPQIAQEAPATDPVALYLAAASAGGEATASGSTKVKATAAHPTGVETLPLPGFERNRNGVILATVGNVAKAVAESRACGVDLRFDTFRGELVISPPGVDQWRPFEDADAVRMRIALAEIGFEPVGKDLMRDAIVLSAADHRFDTAIHWLETVVPAWDGVPRIERFYPDYFTTADTAYTRAVGLYVWTAHAARVLDPGVKADMATILVGPQGSRKSSGVAAMSPSEDFFTEFDLETKDTDLSRKMRGTLVGELGELRGLSVRDADAMKAWVSKRFEVWTPKYLEYETRFPRRLLFHGTTNVDDFLKDPTGERRWLPMRVLGLVDTARIAADRLQLWAEGRARYLADGVLYAEAERLARNEHRHYRAHDPWESPVGRWLDTPETDGGTPRLAGVSGEDVLVMCLGIEASRVQRRDQQRIGEVLKACGMTCIQRKREGVNRRVWVDANDDLA